MRRASHDASEQVLRQGAGVRPGDVVDVVIERDEEERTVEAPPLLKKELAKNKVAQANWQKLSFTQKKWLLPLSERSRKRRGRGGWGRSC
jgi:hypothetical protein